MKKYGLILLFTLFSAAHATSVWEDFDFYERNIEVGDFIKIYLSSQSVMAFESEVESFLFQDRDGEQLSGSDFSFYPDVSISANDEGSRSVTADYAFESDYVVMTRVMSFDDNAVYFFGASQYQFDDESFSMEVSGYCDERSISSDYRVNSEDIFNLQVSVTTEQEGELTEASESDYEFLTNFTDISTNMTISEEGLTNREVITNEAAFNLEFQGITDEAKRRFIIEYLNSMVNSLF